MVEMDYQQIASRGEELYLLLFRHQGNLTATTKTSRGDTMTVIPDVNSRLHEEYPDFKGVFKLCMAATRTDVGYPWWHFTFELEENGTLIGSQWETTCEKFDRLSHFEQAVFDDLHRRN